MKKIETRNKNIYLFIFIFIIFILSSIFILSINYLNIFQASNCENYIANFSESFSLDSYIENNYSLKSSYAFIELDLFPELNSLTCIGKEVFLQTNSSDISNVFTTSKLLYEILLFLGIFIPLVLFKILKSNSKFYYLISVSFYYFSLTSYFYKEITINFYLFFVLFVCFLYYFYFSELSTNNLRDISWYLFITFISLLLIFNYNLFAQTSVFFVMIYFVFFNKKLLSNIDKSIIKIVPVIYYSIRIISSVSKNFDEIWERLSGGIYRSKPRFVDLQYAFDVINCNALDCPNRIANNTRNNYGPIWEYLSLKLNVSFLTVLFGILIILLSQYLYINLFNRKGNSHFYYFLLYTSPPIAFQMERMNIDIFVPLMGYIALSIYKKNKYGCLLIISVLTFIKIYPIFFFVGIALYHVHNKETKSALITFLVFGMHLVSYIFYFIYSSFFERLQDQSGISYSFGIIADSTNIAKYSGIGNFYIIVVISLFILIIQYSFFRSGKRSFLFSSNDQIILVPFLVVFLFVCLFSNIDFRLVLFVIPLIYIFENPQLKILNFGSLLFMSTSVSRYFSGFVNISDNLIDFIFSFGQILINYLSFYFIISILIFELLKYILSYRIINFFYSKK